ncbi:ADP-ribosyltransferase [Rhodococcus qingshengii]|uniref:ADP-ribosyltransferase n=1 Tax=Rhodococcus qingshengii TaxID=334542 RepID=UPI0036DA1C0D
MDRVVERPKVAAEKAAHAADGAADDPRSDRNRPGCVGTAQVLGVLMARPDPWLSERMRADARIRRGERNIYQAVITAMTIWLNTTRQLILGQPVPALTAAADDPIPDIDAAQASFAAWARALENHVEPAIAEAFGEAFAAQSRAADISPVHFQEHHMATVHDRLKIWPEGAFEELRPELLEAMQQNESIEQITDRIGRILDIDAPSRRIRADISAIDAQIADPATDRDELPFLRGKRRRLWNQHDESQQQWKWLARRIARTEIQGAVEGGSLASAQATAEATGEEMYKAWLSTSDERTRASHNVADGQIVKLAEPFRVGVALLPHPAFPGGPAHEVINCVVGSTEVEWPGQGVSDATRRSYRGTFIHLRTARGHVLTITPNHPVLTPAGYVAAGDLRPGQQILATRPSHAPEVRNMPTSIEQIHTALRETRMQQRMVGSAVDFHGDGIEGNEVEVVRPDSDLRIERNFTESSGGEELQLVPLEHRTSSLSRVSSLDVARRDSASLSGGSSFPSSSVRGGSELPPLLWGEALHPNAHRFASGSDRKPEFVKPSGDDGSTDAELVRHLFHAVAVGMSPCEVIEVERFTGNHDVFNLSTTDEWYIGNGIALHNCRCTMRILTYSEMQAELQGLWGGRGVSPMGARLGPDDEADAATAIDRLNRERRGEVLDPIERTEPDVQDTVNVDDDIQENPDLLEPDDEPFTTPHDDIPDLEDDIPDDELHVADEEPDLDADDEELPDHPAVEGTPADDNDNETEHEVHQPDTDPADIPDIEEEPAPPPAPTESVILEPIIETTPTPEPLVFGDLEVDDARRWAARTWPLDRNSFDPDVSRAVTQYTGDYHDVMNASLRGEFLAETSEANQWMVANMRRAIDEAPRVPEPVHVFREVSSAGAFQLQPGDSLATLLGRAFDDLGFMSTSLTQATAGAADLSGGTVMVEIAVPAGYAAIYVSGTTSQQASDILSAFGNAEVELILKDGTTIVITDIEFDSRGRPILQAEIIDTTEGE